MEQVIQTLTVTVTETSSQHQVLERKLTEREKDLENKIVDLQNSLQKVVKINILIIFNINSLNRRYLNLNKNYVIDHLLVYLKNSTNSREVRF